MTDPDTVEALLLQAAGVRRPSSMDISPILALLEEGYDLDRNIIPEIKRAAQLAKEPVSSWRWYAAAIRQKSVRQATSQDSNIDGDFADGERPVWWIRGNDPRYSALAARWAAEKKQQRPSPIASKYFKGEGWAFPAHWVE